MKAAEVRQLGDAELIDRLEETRQEQFNLRFQHVTGQLDNYARLRSVRQDIARLATELREREIAAAEALEAQGTEVAESAVGPAGGPDEESH